MNDTMLPIERKRTESISEGSRQKKNKFEKIEAAGKIGSYCCSMHYTQLCDKKP